VASGGNPGGFDFGRDTLRTFVLDLSRPGDTIFVGTKATGATFSPDGASLLLGTGDSVLRSIDLAKRAVRWEKRFDGVVTRFAFSADGRTAAVAIEPPMLGPPTVLAIASQTGAELRRVANRKTNALALSPDGSELATAVSALVEITRVRDGAVIARLTHPSTLETVQHVGFLPGNRVMSVAGTRASLFFGASFFTEQAVFVWNRATGAVERRLPEGADRAGDYSATLTEEEKPYFSETTWSPNGNEVAAVVFPSRLNYWIVPAPLTSAELRVWRLDTPAPEEVFRAPTDGAPRLLGLDDGAGLLFTADAAVRAWSYRTRGLVEETCRRVTRTFTAAEWRAFISPDESPRATCP
jgi:WD40 repeat protein